MATSDADISDLPVPEGTDISDLPTPQSGVLSSAPGVVSGLATQLKHAGEDIAGGVAHGVGSVVDIFTGTDRGPQSYASKFSAPFQHEPDEEVPDVKEEIRRAAPKLGDLPIMRDPRMQGFLADLGQATEAAGTVVGAGQLAAGAIKGVAAAATRPAAGAIEQGHPLTEIAQAEASRLNQARQAAISHGIDIPERGVPPNVQAVNNWVGEEPDINLPRNSPVTDRVLDGALTQNVKPAYDTVKAVPRVDLDLDYGNEHAGIDTNLIKDKWRPPAGGSITGQQLADYSQYLRATASKYFKSAALNPEYGDIAQAHWDMAQSLEDAGQRYFNAHDMEQVGTNWDAARISAAKIYSVKSALDGAGNVVAPKLKAQLLKNRPLSGNLEQLATVAAMNPDAFSMRPMMPQPGMVRRGTALLAPAAGAALGSMVGGGTGAGLGAGAGRWMSEKLLNPP